MIEEVAVVSIGVCVEERLRFVAALTEVERAPVVTAAGLGRTLGHGKCGCLDLLAFGFGELR